jgi:hypothetical protein
MYSGKSSASEADARLVGAARADSGKFHLLGPLARPLSGFVARWGLYRRRATFGRPRRVGYVRLLVPLHSVQLPINPV